MSTLNNQKGENMADSQKSTQSNSKTVKKTKARPSTQTIVINVNQAQAQTQSQQQVQTAPDQGQKDRTTALLLCIFLGFLGVHRFYVGKSGTGILWLFTGGLCYIGWIVDIILIATGSFTDSMGRPLKK